MNKSALILFVIGILLIPFNAVELFPFLGEFVRESSFIVFITGFILVTFISIIKVKIYLPLHDYRFKILLLFIFWILINFLLNYHEIKENYFKQTFGVNRFIRQFISFIISSLLLTSFYWFVIKKINFYKSFEKIRKIILISYFIVLGYATIEIFIKFLNFSFLQPIVKIIGFVPFIRSDLYHNYTRVSSILYEPPYLAEFLVSISAWLLSYFLENKSLKKYFLLVTLILLTFYSGSRTALIIISFQIFVFFLINVSYTTRMKIITLSFLSFLLFSISLNLMKDIRLPNNLEKRLESLNISNTKNNVSNKSRLGMQVANFEVFKENPIIGVGFGQQGYHNKYHFPKWAKNNNYEFSLYYLNKKEKSFPPGYNLYLRIASELGIIGLILWLSLLSSLIFNLYKIQSTNDKYKSLSQILFISIIGLTINFLQIDSFRNFYFWIYFISIIVLINQISNEKNHYTHTTLQ